MGKNGEKIPSIDDTFREVDEDVRMSSAKGIYREAEREIQQMKTDDKKNPINERHKRENG